MIPILSKLNKPKKRIVVYIRATQIAARQFIFCYLSDYLSFPQKNVLTLSLSLKKTANLAVKIL
jgi:hypothetical protein